MIRTKVTWVRAVVALTFALASLLASVAAPTLVYAEPLRIHLRGVSRIEARTSRVGAKTMILGSVLDDAGQPVARAPVSLALAAASTPALPLPLGARGIAFEPCAEADRARTAARLDGDGAGGRGGGSLSLESDELGAFCVRVALPVDRYVVRLATRGSALYDATQTELRLDLARRTLSLVFDPRPRVLSLDEPTVTLEALARFEDEGATAAAAGLLLTLTNERNVKLASGATSSSGRVRWVVPSRQLGPPGRGELRVVFAESHDTASATFSTEIERHARVDLALALALTDGGAIPAGVPEDGISLPIVATIAGEPASSGSLEAFVGATLVGAAPVAEGRANVTVTFAAGSARAAKVRVRYAADAPWNEPGRELLLTVPLRAPSAWRNVPLYVAALAVVGLLALGRARRARAVRADNRAAPRVRPPEAAVEVVRATRDRAASWTGHVVDAHDGVPVPNARVTIERAGFETMELVASTFADDAGRFVLDAPHARETDSLAIEAPLHTALRLAVPSRGELRVALVLRRRALLDRLVAWARKRGRPFDARPEPTPGHVRRAAHADLPTAHWADAVERAAFGGAVVDAVVEAHINALALGATGIAVDAPASAGALAPDTILDDAVHAAAPAEAHAEADVTAPE